MKFLIDRYLLRNTEDLSFIHLKQNAELKIPNYQLPEGGLELPIFIEELANNIKTKDENRIITVGAIIRGIIYLLGIDSTFKYKDEYIKFLYAANPEIEKYILSEGIKALEKDEQLKAVIYSKSLVLINPTDTKILLNYVLTLLQYRDKELVQKRKSFDAYTDEIKDKLEILLNIDSQQPLAYYYLGFIYKDRKQYTKAKLHWEKALTLSLEENLKEQLNELLRQLEDMVQYENGYEAILSERPQEGLPLLEELEKKYEEWWNLKFFIGLGYRQLGSFHEAVQYFNKVLNIKENQVDALAELGLCYAALGEVQKAIKIYHQVIEFQGDNNEILCNLSMLYLQLGDIEKARKYINTSLGINPHDEITLSCKKKLDDIDEGINLA
ncbi:Tetratricopeptide repeat-containing protein [Anaerovirgula multivorans]|uniref:Tetratricopeptide repeat-containing protein n=1 Tax=Anaerovirgula multivorans TaxID=312168 RepID=A0A239KIW4_9FIRM|nr:tetratricopeptide repeat protein [Anaerovirgula multivorans]SNT17074.1 Tetratricopeptide repeat-containing protein [Anaerovirgula multivorans]